MSMSYKPRMAWESTFLKALQKGGLINRAVKEAGVSTGAYYGQFHRNPEFRRECERIRAGTPRFARAPSPAQWKRAFLEALAETSNVSASAERASTTTREVYRLRREDRNFARDWQAALYEGYVNLEMEVLGYLRDPSPGQKMDVTNALRLLAAHKETIARERAMRTNVSAAEVRASIDRKVEALRQQVCASRAGKSE